MRLSLGFEVKNSQVGGNFLLGEAEGGDVADGNDHERVVFGDKLLHFFAGQVNFVRVSGVKFVEGGLEKRAVFGGELEGFFKKGGVVFALGIG